MLFASLDSTSNDFKIKTYRPKHTCVRTKKNYLCIVRVLSKHYRDRISEQPNIRVFKLQELIRKDFGVHVSKTTARRARSKVIKELMGDVTLEFGKILDYRDALLRSNPRSTCVVKLDDKENKVFEGFYICFDALKKAWQGGCRKLIGLNGCFLKGVTSGQLLVAVTKDGNNQMLPLAWAVVQVENKYTWAWFVNMLKEDLELGDGNYLTITSDMQKGLTKAIRDFLPECEHRWCARHIFANWSKTHKGLQKRILFWACARSTFEAELKINVAELRRIGGDDAVDDLMDHYIKETFCKVYFDESCKNDSIDNNMAESFNAWILGPRHKTIISMLEEIRVKMMNRIAELREFSKTSKTNISPMALKVLEKNMDKSMLCNIDFNGDDGFEVIEGDFVHTVDLMLETCSCRAWMLKGIPCAHAVAAMLHMRVEPIDFVHSCYNKETYLNIYSHFMQLVNNMVMWPESSNPTVKPPAVKQMPGRPKKNRRKEAGEVNKKTGEVSKKGVTMTCSICKGRNHNKRSCPMRHVTQAASTVGSSSSTAAPPDVSSVAPPARVRCKGVGRSTHIGGSSSAPTPDVSSVAPVRASKLPSVRGRGRGAGRSTPYKRPKVAGYGVMVAESGFTTLNPGMPLCRILDTGVPKVRSDHVTGDIGVKSRSGLKWKGESAISNRRLEEIRGQHIIQSRSKNSSQESTSSQSQVPWKL